jgi:hypothetical protein
VRIKELLDDMKTYIAAGDWEGLEKHARKRCEKLTGKTQAAQIAELDMSAYVEHLEDTTREVFESAEEHEAAAIVYEFEMENNWAGTFVICPEYTPEEDEDDDWANDCDEEIDGPECPELAEFYEEGFDSTDAEIGVNAYLIARTVAAFGKCVETMPDSEFAVCIGYNDQELFTRIREAEGRALDAVDEEDEEEEDEEE